MPPLATLSIQMCLGLLLVMVWMLKARGGAAWRETRLRLLGSPELGGGRFSPIVRWLDAHASRGRPPAEAVGPGAP
jgi:hypothetical protein